MPNVTINIVGLRPLLKKLSPARYQKAINSANNEALQFVRTDVQRYPPPRKYRRTFRLRRSWEVRPFNNARSFGGELRNQTPYGGYVMGPRDQAGVHKGIWRTTAMVVKELKNKVNDIYHKAIRGAMQ